MRGGTGGPTVGAGLGGLGAAVGLAAVPGLLGGGLRANPLAAVGGAGGMGGLGDWGVGGVGHGSSGFGAGRQAGISDTEIDVLVNQREIHRGLKDWATADAIRTTLRGRGVELYDNDQLWKASDGRSGRIVRADQRQQPPQQLMQQHQQPQQPQPQPQPQQHH